MTNDRKIGSGDKIIIGRHSNISERGVNSIQSAELFIRATWLKDAEC